VIEGDALDLIGRTFADRYQIVGVLGQGAMGAVYSAEDRASGKPLAIKVLHKFLSSSKEAEARFAREAFVGIRLAHPNCVSVVDSGATDDGSFFLAMELLQGESLGDLLEREGRLPWPRALHIARHVLRGLEHAHRESVVHRDIKPDNIFLTRRGNDADFARILDFGIAKLIGDSAQHGITQAGIAIGTPKYLSPEQAVGGTLDGRSDLYSLSIVLYEMLAGRTPFGDREPLKTVMAHVSEPVPAFADVAPEAAVPPAVEALVRAGLAKLPADRIPSATAYLARIDALIGPDRRARRRTIAIAGVAGLAIAGAIGIAVAARSGGGDAPASGAASASGTAPANAQAVDAALAALENGKTCAARRSAVAELHTLGDPRAIPALQRARTRLRRGKNLNACLAADADDAIAALSRLMPADRAP
jgi:serine/threonine-protein kinase